MKLTNDQKIGLVLKDLKQWAYGNDSLDSMNFALKHNFRLHAASLWLSTGAASEEVLKQVKGIKIDYKAEIKEIKRLLSMADVYICQDCNHHSFVEKGADAVTSCESCLSSNLKLDIKKAA